MKKPLLAAFAAALALQANAQTYSPVTLSGFNADVIANGSGSAMNSTNNGVDNSDFAFVAQNFVNPSNQSPAAGSALPNNGLITSAVTTTPGLTFQLESYTGNNALRIISGASGTLTFATPISAHDVYVLLTPVIYSATIPSTFTVNFTDGTNQVFSNIVLSNNWYGGTGAAYSGTSRVKRATNVIDVQTMGPRIFQQKLTMSAANAAKSIQSILINNNAAVSTTNVLNVLAATTANSFATDAGITAITAPGAGCTFTNQETITVTVKNNGTTALTNIPVSYKINATGTPVNEVLPGPIAAGASAPHSFAAKADLSALGTYVIEARTNLTSDLAPANDATTRTVIHGTAPAVPTISAGGQTSFCTGGSVILTAASTTTGVTYQWFKDGVAIASATNATYNATAAGNYTAVATSGGCSSAASAATAVTVNTLPPAPGVNVTGTTTMCSGDSVIFTAVSAAPNATFTWFNNGNIISGATSANYIAKSAGGYTAVASVNGCNSAASIARTVTVKTTPAKPTVSRSGSLLTSSSASGNQWFKNGTAMPGAIAQSLNASSNGSYTVKVTSNGCTSAASNPVTITNTGIHEAERTLNLNVFPNPSKGVFHLSFPENQTYELVVTDLTGKVLKKQVANGPAQLNLKGKAKGIYLLKVSGEKGTAIRKLIVE